MFVVSRFILTVSKDFTWLYL